MSIITPQQLEMLLPVACAWAVGQEHAIVQSGVPLSESQLADARRVGVAQPERVRLLRSHRFPYQQLRRWRRQLAQQILFRLSHMVSLSVMAFLFERIVGINARSLCMNLSIRHSMSGLVDSRVFCVRTCWSVLPHRAIHMDRWSKRLLLRLLSCVPDKAWKDRRIPTGVDLGRNGELNFISRPQAWASVRPNRARARPRHCPSKTHFQTSSYRVVEKSHGAAPGNR